MYLQYINPSDLYAKLSIFRYPSSDNLTMIFQNSKNVNPKDSFAWKDKTLDTELKALRDARFVAPCMNSQLMRISSVEYFTRRAKKVETRDGGHSHLFDKEIGGSLASWNKLPKAPDQEVILLKKARGKMRKRCE